MFVSNHLAAPSGCSRCSCRVSLTKRRPLVLVVKLKRGVPQRRPGVIVDLTELTSLDATGVTLLQDSQLRLAGAEGCLALVSPEPHHARLSRLIPESATLDVFRSRAEAIAAVHRIVLGASASQRSHVLMQPRAVRSMLDVPAG